MPSQLEIRGEQAFLSVVNQFEREGRKDKREKWVVGTVVGYGSVHEFGSKAGGGIVARPHWRPAIFTLSQGIPGGALPGVRRRKSSNVQIRGRAGAKREWELWWEPEKSSGGAVALALRNEVKKQIKAKGVVDTRNYLLSVAHGKTEAEMRERSLKKLRDKSRAIV